MKIVNADSFVGAMNDMTCGRKFAAEIASTDFEIEQFVTQPIEGYEKPAGFPNCCEGHKSIFELGQAKFSSFPNCCTEHKNLEVAPWFKKENYNYVADKLVTTLSYTMFCIEKGLDGDQWYKEITDYIEYTKNSYGQLPHGYGGPLGLDLYLHQLEHNVKDLKEVSEEKKDKILQFIRKYNSPVVEIEQTDINILVGKYREWLKIFPFELSFLSHLKPYFQRQIPILSGPGEANMYTGMVGYKVKTRRELVDFLVSATLEIIKVINTRQLYSKGLLNDTTKLQLEIVLAKRRVELEELDNIDGGDRRRYIKLLKSWLTGEKRFVKEVSSIFKNSDTVDFIRDLLSGMWALQKNDTNEPCIVNVRESKPDKETAFRYWFKNYFTARYPGAVVTAEEEKGNGRIDLKVSHRYFGDKIVEFKGWWNQDKRSSPEQICSYLTDFEGEGYVFMINHLERKDIVEDYKELISHCSMNYVKDSWKEHRYESTDMMYYESRHLFSVKEKTVFHFVFNVNFSSQSSR